MNEIPEWWLALTGVFFAFGIVYCITGVVVLVMIARAFGDVGRKVQDSKERIDALATTVKGSVEQVGGHAENIAARLDDATGRLGQFAQGVVGLMLALGLLSRVRTMLRRG